MSLKTDSGFLSVCLSTELSNIYPSTHGGGLRKAKPNPNVWYLMSQVAGSWWLLVTINDWQRWVHAQIAAVSSPPSLRVSPAYLADCWHQHRLQAGCWLYNPWQHFGFHSPPRHRGQQRETMHGWRHRTVTHYTSQNTDQNNEYLQDWETFLLMFVLAG